MLFVSLILPFWSVAGDHGTLEEDFIFMVKKHRTWHISHTKMGIAVQADDIIGDAVG